MKKWKVEHMSTEYTTPFIAASNVEEYLNDGWELLHVRRVASRVVGEPDYEIWFFRKEVGDSGA